VSYLRADPVMAEHLGAVDVYRREYGVSA
jgi:hypothetical protein